MPVSYELLKLKNVSVRYNVIISKNEFVELCATYFEVMSALRYRI